jgi:hypothetical protein
MHIVPQVWTAGQVIGLIHDIPSCEDLLNRIEQEAMDTITTASKLIVDKQPEADIRGKKAGDADPSNAGPAVTKSPWSSKL